MSWLTDMVAFLSQDVAAGNHVQSPMLSWLGAGGILALCFWYSIQLIRGQFRIRRTLVRTFTQITRLAVARRKVSKEWVWIPALAKRSEQSPASPPARRDLDDLYELDRVLRSEPGLANDWLSYRKTLGVEQPAWFLEPTVYSQRPVTEYFSFETLCCTNQLNINLYRQLPSVMTGIGLLFTFLAILIGLSKLHANGSQIEGIQGLINGLAGKFVTSVVGLACANLFALLEHSIWHRLEKQHRECIALLDDLFPQKSTVQSTPHVLPTAGMPGSVVGHARIDSVSPSFETVQQRLGATVTALTTASQSIAALTSTQSRVKLEDLAKDIGSEVQKTLRPVLDTLLETLQSLNRSLDEQHRSPRLSQTELETMLKEFKHQQDGAVSSPRHPRTVGK